MNQVTLLFTGLGLIMASVAAWFAWRQLLPPKRELVLSTLPPVSFLVRTPVVLGLEVSRNGEPIEMPFISIVTVENTGSHDITGESFDMGEPIRIELGADVVEVLEVSAEPTRGTQFPVSHAGSQIALGPGLLSRHQKLVIQLLTSGEPSDRALPSRVTHDLIDVDVAFRDASTSRSPSRRVLLSSIAQGLVFAGVLGGTFFLMSETLANQRTEKAEQMEEQRADQANQRALQQTLEVVDLKGIDLVGQDLSGFLLAERDLTGANLGRTNLSDAILVGSDLPDVNLAGSNLTDANLSNATLDGAFLGGATLSGTKLRGVKWSPERPPVWPENFDPPENALAPTTGG